MVEFKPEMMSEDDLLEVANKIFNAQEQDFEKIKSEKWYQTLFHAITLNRDGQKYAVRGMSSLAKLQQLFMNIYVKNYKETNEQLNVVIDAIIQDKNAIKKLYMRILGPEKREDLKDLEPMDAELLVLLLSGYVDENGNAPGRVGEYNTGVRTVLRKNGLIGSYKVTLDKLDELKAPEVIYRCFMEQCAIDGTIDSQGWPDTINPYLDELVLSTSKKNEIKDEVKHELKTTSVDYLINKYICEYETDELFTDEDFDIENDEIEASALGEAEDYVSNEDEPINDDQEDVYLGEREDEYIDNILQIPAGTVKRYANKNIHISAYINCAGTLEFDNCCIYYNESNNADEIAMEEKAKLSIVNSVVICSGLDKMPFISGENGFEVSLITTKFSDCSYFLNAYCDSFCMIGCTAENCFCDFIYVRGVQKCEIRDNRFIHDDLATFNFQNNFSMEEIKIDTNEIVQGYFKNNIFIETDNFRDICRENLKNRLCCLSFSSKLPVSNCTFNGISEFITVSNIRNCYFEKCSSGIYVTYGAFAGNSNKAVIENCVFNECTEAIKAEKNTRILHCQFISCYEKIIEGNWSGGIIIELCEFINMKFSTPEKEKNIWGERIDNLLGRNSSISLWRQKEGNANHVKNCIFKGVDIDNGYLICGKTNQRLSNYVVYVEECSFASCATKRKDKEIIKLNDFYYPKFSKKSREVQTVQVSNCKGLDRVNKDGSYMQNVKVKTTDDSGNPIGASIQM